MKADADAFTPYECDRCDNAHMQVWSCPDLGLRRSQALDVDGTKFNQCPGFWKRTNGPHMIDSRSAYEIGIEARFAIEHGACGWPSSLPGKLHDSISQIMNTESRKLKRDTEEARSKSSGRTRLKVV